MRLSRNTTGGIYATVCLLLIAGAVVFFAVMSMEERNTTVGKVRNAEAKSELHDIQVQVERFETDMSFYPFWLIGGEPKYSNLVDTADPDSPFQEISDCLNPKSVSDPLLRQGYIDSYPRNPFIKNGIGLHQCQLNCYTCPNGSDPLINGSDAGAKLGTRFGARCNLMGNVMGDPRSPSWGFQDPITGDYEPLPSGAAVDYFHWDMEKWTPPAPHFAGQFFYKANWRINPPTGMDWATRMPDKQEPTMYIMGSYGAVGEKGKDVIGDEHQLMVIDQKYGKRKYWTWTRSQIGGNHEIQGSPYGQPEEGSDAQFSFGNPNGFADAVVLVLTGCKGSM